MNPAADLRDEARLLESVQAYLHRRLRKQAPDGFMTQAWEDFYTIYSQVVAGIARRYGVGPAEVEDVVQEVWATVIVKLPQFHWDDNRAGVRAWMYRVVFSKAMDLLRRKARRPFRDLSKALMEEQEPADVTADPAVQFERLWQRELVQAVLAELRRQVDEVNFRVLYLRFMEERPVAEVAATLGLSSEDVWSRQHRMLRKFRAAMAVYTGQAFEADH